MLSLLTHSKPQDRGEVSEWFKEAVLKTVEQQCSVGSNPTFSAKNKVFALSKNLIFMFYIINTIPYKCYYLFNRKNYFIFIIS